MNNDSMIPVFVPRKIGMRAVYAFAREQDCKLVLSRSGAIVLEPRESKPSGTVIRFPVLVAPSAPEVA